MLRNTVLFCAALTLCAGCGQSADESRADAEIAAGPVAPPADPMVHIALAPTAGNAVSGMLMLTERANGVALSGSVSGLKADSEAAIHVHEIGDCSAPDASSAGEHFNPTTQPHGNPAGDAHHLGDIPNLKANNEGVAQIDVTVDELALTGPENRSVANRAIVIHALPDDYKTQPSGASGARVACGVIPANTPAS